MRALLIWRDPIVSAGLGVCIIVGAAMPAFAQEGGGRASKSFTFDIPAQPLAQALDAYAHTTGMAALVDQELIVGRRSASLKGQLKPDEALRILLAGNGLSVHYASENAFTLESAERTLVSGPAANAGGSSFVRNHQNYFADLQESLTRVLCRRSDTEPGRYRLGVQLWIGANGAVLASHLLDSTGDDRRDAAIVDVVGSATVAVPPPEMPQPVTVVFVAHPAQEPSDCR